MGVVVGGLRGGVGVGGGERFLGGGGGKMRERTSSKI